MHQMQIDVEQVRLTLGGSNDMPVPELVGECFGLARTHSRSSSSISYVHRDVDDPAITVEGCCLIESAQRGDVRPSARLDDVRCKTLAGVNVLAIANPDVYRALRVLLRYRAPRRT